MTFSQKWIDEASKGREGVVINNELVTAASLSTSVGVGTITAATSAASATAGSTTAATATATTSGWGRLLEVITTLETEKMSVSISSSGISVFALQVLSNSGLVNLDFGVLLDVLHVGLLVISDLVLNTSSLSVGKEIVEGNTGVFLLFFFLRLDFLLDFFFSRSFFLLFLSSGSSLSVLGVSSGSFTFNFFFLGFGSVTHTTSSVAILAVTTSDLVTLASVVRVSIFTRLTLVSLSATTTLYSVSVNGVTVLINSSGSRSALSATFTTTATASASAVTTASALDGTAGGTTTLALLLLVVSDFLVTILEICNIILRCLLNNNLLRSLLLLNRGSSLLLGLVGFDLECLESIHTFFLIF